MMKRRKFLQQGMLASAGVMIAGRGIGEISESAARAEFPVVRIPEAQRKFKSQAVEKMVREVRASAGNKEIGWLFENCFPNTLDTTVDFGLIGGKPDTYVITGDIDAMWLRDSSAQVWPYIPLCKEDKDLQQLIRGVIHRQVKCILKDPYANAFYKDETKISEWKATDLTDMKPGVHERKWEIDSICYPIRLSHGYWQITGDTSPFDAEWISAMEKILQTFREQQRKEGKGPYHFMRKTEFATDTVPLRGYGYPTKKVGLIHSMFRPSDDATIYPFLIPSNIFALNSLSDMRALFQAIGAHGKPVDDAAYKLMDELSAAITEHAIITHPVFGEVFAYEADGFGNHTLMDDANVPSLLGLPYLQSPHFVGPLSVLHPEQRGYTVYQNTRRMLLSESNPFFFKGKAGEGIGGPHVGTEMIWPLSIIIRGLTSHDSQEMAHCLKMLQQSNAGTGFMHESFHKDDAAKFTRKWFAWANTLFGEFVLKVYHEHPALLS
ncbi:glycoside hydrolase family 125 protein [Puia sp.]|uniref:glycoside hydrolase family 125 protein n=1 Tax=Puia sp. TaxID=2045100 RepID=UPI002F4222FE